VSLKDQYVSQRARGAYVATVSQPEAAFDLSFAAQAVGPPTKEQIEQLNKSSNGSSTIAHEGYVSSLYAYAANVIDIKACLADEDTSL
jgi:hypothetical protein